MQLSIWIIALSVIAAAAVVAGWWLFRTRPWAGPRTRYPVVLVHGVLGFDEIQIGTSRQNYFRGIVEHLEKLGVTVHRPRLPPLSSVADRAVQLAEAIRAIPAKRVNIIAHSMGGLDARYAIRRLGLKKRVASLVTIGTPHTGTPLADLGARMLGEKFGLGMLLKAVGMETEAVRDLTTEHMAKFNRQTADAPGIFYGSVVGTVDPDRSETIHPLLKVSHRYLEKRTGPGDGLVPAQSQRWGTVLSEIKADHWAQIGWSPGFDAPRFYEQLAITLRKRGL